MEVVPRSMMRVTSPVFLSKCHLRSRSMILENRSRLIDLQGRTHTALHIEPFFCSLRT
jgi:hypothetical protein